MIEFNMNAKPADRETVTFDYGIPAELFMGSARAGHDPRCAIAVLRPQRRRSGSLSRNFQPCARSVPGCRSVTNASMATTFNACTRATITHCNGVRRINCERQWVSLIVRRISKILILSRQVAPLLRKFCKVSAYFTIASQRGHALTMPRDVVSGSMFLLPEIPTIAIGNWTPVLER